MDLIIEDFNPDEADAQSFDVYTEYHNTLFKELYPRDPVPPKEYFQKQTRSKKIGEKLIRRIIYDKDRKICACNIILVRTTDNSDYEKNKSIANMFITSLEINEFQKFAEILLKDALKILEEYKDITTIETCTYRAREKQFWEMLSAKVLIVGAQNRLYLEDVNWELMNKWKQSGHKRAQKEKIELLSFDRCPEDIIYDYAKLYTTIMKLVPIGDFEWRPETITPKKIREEEQRRKTIGYKWHTMVTRESSGDLSGLTEIFYHESRPHQVEQELTGVTLKHRGRGLGKWLKAEMLLFIRDKYPDVQVIITGNADSNTPMLSINERMGFKKYLEEKCFGIKIKDIFS